MDYTRPPEPAATHTHRWVIPSGEWIGHCKCGEQQTFLSEAPAMQLRQAAPLPACTDCGSRVNSRRHRQQCLGEIDDRQLDAY